MGAGDMPLSEAGIVLSPLPRAMGIEQDGSEDHSGVLLRAAKGKLTGDCC